MMKSAELTHIIFYTSKLSETAAFWENILGLKNHIVTNKNRLQYKFGKFMVMFNNAEKPRNDYSDIIAHLGIEFPAKKDVDVQYEKLKDKLNIPKPIGGLGKGPYRFYIKDPNGIPLEFETWEDCSD